MTKTASALTAPPETHQNFISSGFELAEVQVKLSRRYRSQNRENIRYNKAIKPMQANLPEGRQVLNFMANPPNNNLDVGISSIRYSR